jgi:hypothetical protein
MVRHPASELWNEIDVATLQQLWDRGLSAAMIACEIHRSRSAVCGKLHRLNLWRRGERSIKTKPPEVCKPKMPKAPKQPKVARVAAAAARNFAAVKSTATPVPFLRARRFHCRAVLDQRGPDGLAMFCGARKVPGSPWCREHHLLFHNYGRA